MTGARGHRTVPYLANKSLSSLSFSSHLMLETYRYEVG
jgi:hypothetical protein